MQKHKHNQWELQYLHDIFNLRKYSPFTIRKENGIFEVAKGFLLLSMIEKAFGAIRKL